MKLLIILCFPHPRFFFHSVHFAFHKYIFSSYCWRELQRTHFFSAISFSICLKVASLQTSVVVSFSNSSFPLFTPPPYSFVFLPSFSTSSHSEADVAFSFFSNTVLCPLSAYIQAPARVATRPVATFASPTACGATVCRTVQMVETRSTAPEVAPRLTLEARRAQPSTMTCSLRYSQPGAHPQPAAREMKTEMMPPKVQINSMLSLLPVRRVVSLDSLF